MICSKCGNAYDDSFVYCPYCGTKAQIKDLRKCPYCAEWIKAKAIKCRYCGESLEDKPQATNSEKRQAAVVSEKETVKQEKGKDEAPSIASLGGFISPPRGHKKPKGAVPVQLTPVSLDEPDTTIERPSAEIAPQLPTTEEEVIKERRLFIKIVLSAIACNILISLLVVGIAQIFGVTQDEAKVLETVGGLVSFAAIAAVIYATIRLGKVLKFGAKQWIIAFLLFLLCYWLSFGFMLSESKRAAYPKLLDKDQQLPREQSACPNCGSSPKAGAIWCDKCGTELSIKS